MGDLQKNRIMVASPSMNLKRPLGVTLWGGFFTVIGGIALLVLFIEILICISNSGIQPLFIVNLQSLLGFFLYAVIPIIFYITGIGLFLLRPWARKMIFFVNPLLIWSYLVNIGCHISQTRLYRPVDLIMAPGQNPQLFLPIIFICGILIFSTILYFIKPEISRYF